MYLLFYGQSVIFSSMYPFCLTNLQKLQMYTIEKLMIVAVSNKSMILLFLLHNEPRSEKAYFGQIATSEKFSIITAYVFAIHIQIHLYRNFEIQMREK